MLPGVKPGEVETFHDQVGFWLWEPAAHTVTLTLGIPRWAGAPRVGSAQPDTTDFEVRATLGSETKGILSNPFLEQSFKTVSYRVHVTVQGDGTWSYAEEGALQIPGRAELFSTPTATRSRVGAPTPNPLARRRRREPAG